MCVKFTFPTFDCLKPLWQSSQRSMQWNISLSQRFWELIWGFLRVFYWMQIKKMIMKSLAHFLNCQIEVCISLLQTAVLWSISSLTLTQCQLSVVVLLLISQLYIESYFFSVCKECIITDYRSELRLKLQRRQRQRLLKKRKEERWEQRKRRSWFCNWDSY